MSAEQQTTPKRPGAPVIMLQRIFMKTHIALYRLTGGTIGGRITWEGSRIGKRTFLLLTTIGRKSGKKRVTPLFYLPDGDHMVLVASNWGAPTYPVWWRNLQANSHAQVQIGRKVMDVTARQANAEESTGLWAVLISRYADFANYKHTTAREIPLVILMPEAE